LVIIFNCAFSTSDLIVIFSLSLILLVIIGVFAVFLLFKWFFTKNFYWLICLLSF